MINDVDNTSMVVYEDEAAIYHGTSVHGHMHAYAYDANARCVCVVM